MGLYHTINLDDNGHKRTIYRCKGCLSHLFTSSNIVSDNFRGRHGKGYLVNRVVNIKTGELEQRSMLTGEYKVCDTLCQQCNTYVGWRYVKSDSEQEKYKEGKFVMEIPQLRAPHSQDRLAKKLATSILY